MLSLLRKNRILIAVLVIAALLRFIGTKPGHSRFHPDETIIYGTAVDMIRGDNLDPGRFDYPGGVIYINYLLFKFLFIPLSWTKYYLIHISEIIDGIIHIPISPLEKRKIFQEFVLGEREINVLFWGRYVTAFFGLGNVLLIYHLAKHLFNKRIGIIAAFLLTFNFRHVLNSHLGLPDIYNSFFLLLSFLVTHRLWKNPSKKSYLLAGIVAGISFSVKYQFLSFFPLVLVHFYIAGQEGKLNWRKLLNKNIILTFSLVPLVFLILNPYFLPKIELALSWLAVVSRKYAMGAKKLNLFSVSYLYQIDLGPLEFFMVLLGLVFVFKKYIKKALLLLSVVIPFIYIFFYYSNGGFYVRNLITISPILLIFAAVFINELFRFFQKRFGKRTLMIAVPFLMIAFVFIPARNSIANVYYYTKPWNYSVLSDWLYENWQEEWIVGSHPFDPPTGAPDMKKTEFKIEGNWSLPEHREAGAGFALINLDWAGNPFYFWMNYGLDDFDIFWNKPIEIMRNTFHGLAIEELFRYQLFSITKPWQAPDAALILTKLPEWPKVKMHTLKQFAFDQNEDGVLLLETSSNRFGTERITLDFIEIEPKHLYQVRGFLKAEKQFLPDQRDGFLRVDFYSEGERLISSISSRLYGTDGWIEKEILERAPEGAEVMLISLQAGGVNSKFWLDNVVVKESIEEVDDITSKPPYIKRDIDLNLLYPNSHGNL